MINKIYFGFLLCFISCTENKIYEYILIDEGDGVFIERFDTIVKDDNKYTQNNTVYKAGNNYVFDFVHITKSGEYLNFNLQAGSRNWIFNSQTIESDTTVNEFSLTVVTGLSSIKEFLPNYNQTIIQYLYENNEGKKLQRSETGVIDNEKNIWMHPPRSAYFRILQINPYPFIQAPFEVGNTWKGTFESGEQWGDKRWATWNGNMKFDYVYTLTDISEKETAFGSQLCYEVTGVSESKLGQTKLISLFNFDYGFMKLDYTNIDGSKTIIELKKFKAGK